MTRKKDDTGQKTKPTNVHERLSGSIAKFRENLKTIKEMTGELDKQKVQTHEEKKE